MLNSIIAVGRLTKDPELRKSANTDMVFANFSVAIDNARAEADGTRGTCFLDATAFGSQAEAIAKSLHKGSKVAISGSLNQRDFVITDGSKGRAYEINVEHIEFLDPKSTPVEAEDEGEDEPVPEAAPTPKFDPMTGKPLTPKAKK